MSHPLFLTKLHLKNYKSIRDETVTFANPLILVGRNGSGKSNFVDALAFVANCMTNQLQTVIELQGGVNAVQTKAQVSDGTPYISVRLDFRLSEAQQQDSHYAFQLEVHNDNTTFVTHEQCFLYEDDKLFWLDRKGSSANTNIPGVKLLVDLRALALPLIGGTAEFNGLVRTLSAVRTYAIVPSRIRGVEETNGSSSLRRDGANLASVLQRLKEQDGETSTRVSDILRPVVPGLVSVSPVIYTSGPDFGDRVGLTFTQEGMNRGKQFQSPGSSMSDGTLRVLGLIVAVLQEPPPPVLVIEEPEATIHSGALGTVADLIELASQRSQVVITTHSPELLDTKWIAPENIRVVQWEQGATRISPLGDAPVKALQQHLMGAGELLRANALDAAPPTEASQDDLFEKIAA